MLEAAKETGETGALADNIAAGPAGVHSRKRVARGAMAALGFICFGLALVGVALPFVPATPFLLAAAFCFARSSDRLDAWFKSTRLYRHVLAGYAKKRSMTAGAKLAVLCPVTALLGVGFMLMPETVAGRVAVVLVWVCHLVYFGFMVKTDVRRGGAAPMRLADTADCAER